MNSELANPDKAALQLQAALAEINNLAEQNQADILFLLSLLRSLEQVHRDIRSNLFETSLPSRRNDLYNLVKDIEEAGGWPYIERMRLKDLLRNIKTEETQVED